MEDTLLTAGALSSMMSGEFIDEAVLVQVLGSLKLDGIVEGHEHYRLLISDGQHVMSHVMLTLKLNDMGTTTPPERFSIIYVKEYFTTLVPRPGVIRTMLVLADVQVMFAADEIQGQIGNPSALFDEDVVIVPRDTLPLPEPVFAPVSTVYVDSVVAVQEALPVVQALPKGKLQRVRALSLACLPNTVRTIDLSTSDAHTELVIPVVQSPSTQATPPAVKLTHSATPKLEQKTPAVQIPTPAVQLTPTATPNPVKKPRLEQITPPVPLTHSATSIPMKKSSPVEISTPAVQLTPAATPIPLKKPRLELITPAVPLTHSATSNPMKKSLPVQISTPATHPATSKPVKKPRFEQITPAAKLTHPPAPKLVQKPPAVQIPTPAVQLTHSATSNPVKKPRFEQITPTVKLTHTATSNLLKKSWPVEKSTPAVQLTPAATPIPLKKPRLEKITPTAKLTHAVTPMQKPSPVQILTPVFKPASGTNSTRSFSSSVPTVTPIATLRPTTRNWTIKARVTAKSPIKPWARGSGCSFTADLADESGEIKATVFTEWVNKFFGIFQKDQVYYISRANLKSSNRRFNHLNHDYEMILNGASLVVPCDEQVTVPETTYKFVPLSEITSVHGSVIDVIGVCVSAAEIETVMTRGGAMPKREVTLLDHTFTTISLKLWGEHAGAIEPNNRPIIAVRGAMVHEYCGVTNLTTLVSSVVRINPDIPEAQRLRKCFCDTGKR